MVCLPLMITTQTFDIIKDGLPGYQCNYSHMTTEKHTIVTKCEQTLSEYDIWLFPISVYISA